ncbi:hypothetical protein SGLAD_v1c01060 [Spiroplasma gladiatoris]|uniref:DUF4064 domain-containing protein n=1 Tax=Spiroplasma gladiatoris TaxID=2143 RepID=A0A4P7AGP6_9MOLU|nr:hypothetical protein [Spiroplasma gladiatoris]QBQ07307.1 hypothetical protein SGLAD_v1c01060 [Spiroplasma gladiatoris]
MTQQTKTGLILSIVGASILIFIALILGSLMMAGIIFASTSSNAATYGYAYNDQENLKAAASIIMVVGGVMVFVFGTLPNILIIAFSAVALKKEKDWAVLASAIVSIILGVGSIFALVGIPLLVGGILSIAGRNQNR